MSDLPLDDIDIPGIDDGTRELTDSVKYHGPPGTGKTTTMAAHAARIIETTGYTANDICWVTYRKSLAVETIDRLIGWGVIDEGESKNLRDGVTRYMGTIHAIGNRSVGGLDAPADRGNKIGFCASVGLDFWSASDWQKGDGELLFRVFGWMLNNRLDPGNPDDVTQCTASALEDFNEQCRKSVPKLWNRWESYKADRDLIDFADQLRVPVERNARCPKPILLIDEYHDAYPLMSELVEQWIDDAEIAIVSGDPNQVVNAYDGASPEFFNGLDMPKQLLDTSWRVPTCHKRLSWDILDRAPGHEPPSVETVSEGSIHHHNTPGTFEQHRDAKRGDVDRWTTPRIDTGHPGQTAVEYGVGGNDLDGPGFGKDPDSVLILARTRNQVRGICAALDDAGMLFTTQRDMTGWKTKKKGGTPMRQRLFNALETIRGFDPGRTTDLYPNTLSLGAKTPGDGDAVTFDMHPTVAASLLDATRSSTHAQPRGETDEIANALRSRPNTKTVDEREFCDWVAPEFWAKYANGHESVEHLLKGAIDGRERHALKNALGRHAGGGPIDVEDIGVEVMTIHASKGHEATDVILYAGITKTADNSIRTDPTECANEYRTWHVATSRAQERLHIVHDGFDWIVDLPGRPLSRGMTTGAYQGVASSDD